MAKTTRHHASSRDRVRLAARAAVLATAVLASVLPPGDASAQCVQTGSDVDCSGVEPNGFAAAAAEDDLTITVQPGAVVQDGATAAAIAVNAGNTIVVEQTALVSANGPAVTGVLGTGSNQLTNRGDLIVSGNGAFAVAPGADSTVTNEATGRIIVGPSITGGGGVGIGANQRTTVVNDGLIQVSGVAAMGVRSASGGTITNTGTIRLPDANGVAVVLDSFVQGPGGSTLVNSGTIEATSDGGVGVRIDDSGASVSNSGTITGGGGIGSAVLFNATFTQQNTFTNEASGTISAVSGIAIRAGVSDDLVVNHGSIVGEVRLGSSTDEVDNFGTLMGDVNLGDGVDVLDNQGTITGNVDTGNGDDTLDNSGTITGTIDLQAGTDVLINTGAGTLTGDVRAGDGNDRLDNQGAIIGNVDTGANDDTLDNSGTITGTVDLQAGNDVLTNSGTVTGNIETRAGNDRLDNSGTINGVVVLGDGFDQLTNSSVINGDVAMGADGDLVVNDGTITGNLDLGTGNDLFQNRGTLDGNVILGDGDDRLRLETGSSLTGSTDGSAGTDVIQLRQATAGGSDAGSFDLGSSTNVEVLSIGAVGEDGTWTISGTGSYTGGLFVDSGTAQFASGAAVQDALSISNSVMRFGDGTQFQAVTASGASMLVFESGSSTQATTVTASGGVVLAEGVSALTGDLTFGPGATYEASFDTSASSRLDVDGAIDVQTGAALSLVQTDTSSIQQTYRVLSATQGVTGEFDGIAASAFQSISPIYGPAAGPSFVDVAVASSFTLPASSPNEEAVGQHLDLTLPRGPSNDFAAFLSTLLQIQDASTASKALASLGPERYDVHTSASLETGRTYAGLLARHPLRCEQLVSPYRRDVPSLAPCSERGFTPWVQGFGRYADRNGDSDHVDWSYGGGGIAVGVDHDLTSDVIVSAMLGTSRMALDFDGDGDGSTTTFELGLGAGWKHGGTYARGAVSYGHGWHVTRRPIDVPGFDRLAKSDYGSDRVSALVEAGHTFVLGAFEIEPRASVDFTYLAEESFDETNAGVLDLDVDRRENGLVGTDAGFRASMTLVKWAYAGTWLEWADGVWRPEIRASWRQVWNDYDRSLSSRLRGAPSGTPKFRTETEDAQVGADLGARVVFQPQGTRNTIELGYEAFVGDGNLSHTVMAVFRIPL